MFKSHNYKSKLSKNSFLYLRYIPLTFVIFLIAFTLLKFPQNSTDGIKQGLTLCFSTLIPSLFPFMVLCSFFVNSGLCQKVSSVFTVVTQALFKQPGVSASVILLSLIGGYPIGSKLICDLYDKKQLSVLQAQRLMLFCINSGPAFAITGVGYFMLGSKEIGLIIYCSLVLSSLLLGFLTRFFFYEDEKVYSSKSVDTADKSISESLVSAVSQSSMSMIAICAWVVLFSCLSHILNVCKMSNGIRFFLVCILEVTIGCESARSILPAHIICGILAFSGFCVHFQVMSNIIKIKLKYKYFLTARIICSAFSIIICKSILNFCSIETQVFATSAVKSSDAISMSIPISIGLILMSALVLLGDNYKFKFAKAK